MKKFLFKVSYWLVQLTWGILMTVAGMFATVFCLIFLKGKIHKNGSGFITEVGGNWGGVCLGAFALCGNYSISNASWFDFTRRHEFGHSLQNMIFGPFFLFVVAIPSAVRYWLSHFGKLKSGYYDVWFEATASSWGTKVIGWLEVE